MSKRVVVIASGETERRALPYLVRHLEEEGVSLLEVRIPPRHRALSLEMAERLIKASWYERISEPPSKFVILVDVDGKLPTNVLNPYVQKLLERLGPSIAAVLHFAYAQWHLEAWYFADDSTLRKYLGKSLGSVDASAPDQIQNPKEHLKQLLGKQAYTAVISEEIARTLDPPTIEQRSPSFASFLNAMRNGPDPR